MSNQPGRPKGTRVISCTCGRRVAGLLRAKVACSGCGRRVLIKEGTGGLKKPLIFLLPGKAKKKGRNAP